jgi:hypothetical protein
MHGGRKIHIWLAMVTGLLLLYWFSVGPFFRWEHSARTWKQYSSRKQLEGRVYAPLIWLEKIDPTRCIFYLNHNNIQMWIRNDHFETKKLPRE